MKVKVVSRKFECRYRNRDQLRKIQLDYESNPRPLELAQCSTTATEAVADGLGASSVYTLIRW